MLARGERIARNHVAHFARGAQHYVRTEAVSLLNAVFDAPGESAAEHEIALRRAENDIAALYVGLRTAQLERRADIAQRIHPYLVVPAYVDPSKKTNDCWHGSYEYSGDKLAAR